MKLDTNQAWRQASAAVSANAGLLLPVAGVFFLLPQLALSLFGPEPHFAKGLPPAEMMTQLQAFYITLLPFLLPIMVLQAVGMLTMITLFTDNARPTVAKAIARGFTCTPSLLAAQVLFALGLSVAGGVVLAIPALIAPAALLAMVPVVLVGAAIGSIRTVLSANAIVTEGRMNPIEALKRSWQLTKGNAWRILGILALLMLALMVVSGAVAAVAGIVARLALNAEWARMASSLAGALAAAVYVAYNSAVLAAIHAQLTGDTPSSLAATFE